MSMFFVLASQVIIDTIAPTAPTNLSANVTNQNTSYITLQWTHSTDNVGVNGYQIWRSEEFGIFSVIGNTTENVYTDFSAQYNSRYSYKIKAYDAAGNFSEFSNIGTTSFTGPQYVSTNDRIYISNQGNPALNNTVGYPSGIIDGDFMILYIMIHDGTVINTPAGWTLRQNASYPNSPNGAFAIFWKVAVGTPTGTVPMSGNGNTRFGLIYNFRNVESIEYSIAIPNSGTAIAIPGTINTLSDNTLVANMYLFRGAPNVASKSTAAGWSWGSNPQIGSGASGAGAIIATKPMASVGQPGQTTVNLTTAYNTYAFSVFLKSKPVSAPPTTPTNIVITNIASTTLTISWTASTDDTGINQYQIFANGSQTALAVINTSQSTGTVTYNVTGLTASTSYYFNIYARDTDFNFSNPGLSSTINTAAAQAGPATPTGLFANTFSDTEISTGWNASTGATGYQLYRSNSADGIYDLVIDTTTTSHIDSFLGSSNTYYYKIAAYNGSNFSALSNTVSATTSGGGSQTIQ